MKSMAVFSLSEGPVACQNVALCGVWSPRAKRRVSALREGERPRKPCGE